MKSNILFKNTFLVFVLFAMMVNGQIAEGFNTWTPRLYTGNWTQNTPKGSWTVNTGKINPTGSGNGIGSDGYIFLEKDNGSVEGGKITTPNIGLGGVKSVQIRARVEVKSEVKNIPSPFKLQKSVDDGPWVDVANFSTTSIYGAAFNATVNDFNDNVKLRIYNSTGDATHRSLFVFDVIVNHSFVLSSDNSTICSGSPVTLSADSAAPFNYTWTSSAGGNLNQTSGSTVTANPTHTTTYTATGTYTTSYGTVTEIKTINVNVNPKPTATLTGSGIIDTEPGAVNLQVALTGTAPWTIAYTTNGINPQTITGITNLPYILTVSPDTNTTYELTGVSDANCTGNAIGTSSVLVNKTVWRESNGVAAWSNGIPNSTLNTYIFEPYVTDTNGAFISRNVTIGNNGSLTVSPNTVITANQYINNNTSDRFVVESDANIMQSSELTNIGNITVRRVANMAKMHYTYWSSPVSNQNLYSFSDGGLVGGTPKGRFYMYNESNDLFLASGINDTYTFKEGQGYAIRGKDSYNADFNSPSAYTFTFTGLPNNGNLAYQYLKWTNAAHGFNLVGNPYPSNLDFDALYDANSSLIYGTAYFWTNQQYIPGQQGGDYSGSNYAIYNRSGGVPATFQDGVESPIPTQYVKVGQGFLVQGMSGSNNQPLQFANNMRSYSASSIFFNRQEAKSKDRYWLNLKSPSNINNTILVSYIQGATDGYERLYDADLLVLGSDAFYTTNGTAKLAIQGRKYPLSSDDVVTLGAKYFETGNYTITLKDKEGLFTTGQAVYLKDKKLNKLINLSEEGKYTFSASQGTDETRFEVIYQDIVSFDSANRSAGNVSVIKDEVEVVVIDTVEDITAVDVFDASGKLVRSVSGKNSKEIRVGTSGLIKGVYILKITSNKGITTKKVIL